MHIPNITFVVFTFNEESRLPRVIRNFAPYGPILVVDNHSTDRTTDIARAAGCEVLLNKNSGWVEDFQTTEKVKAAVSTDWIYWAFADEILEARTLEEIRAIVTADRHDVIRILRRNYFQGRFCYDIGATYQTKVFKKHAIDFRDNRIHGFGEITVPPQRVCMMSRSYHINHLMGNTVASLMTTTNRYTDLEMSVGRPWNRAILYCMLLPIKTLWGDFFVKRGYRAGRAGFSLSALLMIYSLVTTLKHMETQRECNADGIAALNARMADELLDGQDGTTSNIIPTAAGEAARKADSLK